MSDAIARLRQEIAAMEQAIASLAALPAMQAPLQTELAAKRRQLAELTGGAPGAGGGDQITTGNVSGTGIAIGRGAQSIVRTVNTGGGDYAEGNIDKSQRITLRGSPATTPAAPQIVLAAYAAPRGTTALTWAIEERALRDCLAPYPERFRIEPLPRATPEELHQALLRLKPAYLHILSHGDASDLLFQDSSGDQHPVPRAALLQTIANTPSLRCVILSACDSAAELTALGPGMPSLVAMRAAISSDSARAFAQGFYEAIAAGHAVRAAYAAGRDRMRLLAMGDEDVPVLVSG